MSLIENKECLLFKKFLLDISEKKLKEVVQVFRRSMSLFEMRSELRGRLGLPRTRSFSPNQDSKFHRQRTIESIQTSGI